MSRAPLVEIERFRRRMGWQFEWVSSHVFGKSVASVMDSAGLSSRAAADQLRHANTSMTTDVYFGRKVLTTGAAAVLEVLGT